MLTTQDLAHQFDAEPVTAELPVIRDGDAYIVLQDRDPYRVEGRTCECGHQLGQAWPEEPLHTPPEFVETAYENACLHQQAVLMAEPIGPCPSCGIYLADRTAFYRQTGAIETRWACQNCGEARSNW